MKHKSLLQQIQILLKELRLPAIKDALEESLKNAQAESLSYQELLHELFQLECESRYNRRVTRYMNDSKLPLEKGLENFDLKILPIKVKQQYKTLLDGLFLERKENILVFGKPGTGKTHLVVALAKEQIKKGKRMYFCKCDILVQDLLIAKRDLNLTQHLRNMSKYDAIIIDDIGYVQQSREEMEVLFTLLADRYERGSVIITSNLPFSKWEQIFKDSMTTAAAIDRLVHHCVILELNVKSYRMEAANHKKGGTKPSKN